MKKTALFASVLCACVCLSTRPVGAVDMYFGSMKANRILFLGNSVTLHGPKPEINWEHNWGMAASAQVNDYVHLLAKAIEKETGGTLLIDPRDPSIPLPDDPGDANVVNISGPIEKRYASYDGSTLQQQFAAMPDIVVLQFGENMEMGSFNAVKLKNCLRSLMTTLKNGGNPHIFVTSYILADHDGRIDAVKQEVCAEDPSHRVFVDLNKFRLDPTNYGSAEPFYPGEFFAGSHPGNKGMKFIADGLFEAMQLHSVPEPNTISLLMLGLLCLIAYLRCKR